MSNSQAAPPKTHSTSTSDPAQTGTAPEVSAYEEISSAAQSEPEQSQAGANVQADVNCQAGDTNGNRQAGDTNGDQQSATEKVEETAETFVTRELWKDVDDEHQKQWYGISESH